MQHLLCSGARASRAYAQLRAGSRRKRARQLAIGPHDDARHPHASSLHDPWQIAAASGDSTSVSSIQPNFMSADVPGHATIAGAWTGSVTAVTIGGAAASIVSQSTNSVVVTVPAGTASATAVDVQVTAGGHTGTLIGGFWYLPAGAVMQWDAYNHASLTFNGGTISAIADSSANAYGAAQTTASYQPTYVSSVAALNGRPALQCAGTHSLQGGTLGTPLVLPATLIMVGSLTVNDKTVHDQIYLDGIDSANRVAAIYSGSDETTAPAFGVYSGGQFLTQPEATNTAFCAINSLASAFASCIVYNGSTVQSQSSTSGSGLTGQNDGITWGARFAPVGGVGYGLWGYTALALAYRRQLSASDVAIVAGIMHAVFGSPS